MVVFSNLAKSFRMCILSLLGKGRECSYKYINIGSNQSCFSVSAQQATCIILANTSPWKDLESSARISSSGTGTADNKFHQNFVNLTTNWQHSNTLFIFWLCAIAIQVKHCVDQVISLKKKKKTPMEDLVLEGGVGQHLIAFQTGIIVKVLMTVFPFKLCFLSYILIVIERHSPAPFICMFLPGEVS